MNSLHLFLLGIAFLLFQIAHAEHLPRSGQEERGRIRVRRCAHESKSRQSRRRAGIVPREKRAGDSARASEQERLFVVCRPLGRGSRGHCSTSQRSRSGTQSRGARSEPAARSTSGRAKASAAAESAASCCYEWCHAGAPPPLFDCFLVLFIYLSASLGVSSSDSTCLHVGAKAVHFKASRSFSSNHFRSCCSRCQRRR